MSDEEVMKSGNKTPEDLESEDQKRNHLYIPIMAGIILIIVSVIIILYCKDTVMNNIASALTGIGGSLIAWAMVAFVIQYKEEAQTIRIKRIVKNFNALNADTEKLKTNTNLIVNMLAGGYLKEATIKKDTYKYDQHYSDASEIKISGIALKGLRRHIEKFPDVTSIAEGHLLKNLQKRKLKVQILLLNPKARMTGELRKYEAGKSEQPSGAIKEAAATIECFESMVKRVKSLDIHEESEMTVKITDLPLNNTLFYAADNDKDESFLLMGMLYLHEFGENSEGYLLPKNSTIFNNCLGNFNMIFNHAFCVVSWTKDECVFYSPPE